MSIEKVISPTLSNLIAEANNTFENAKSRILAVYNYAVEKDGFTPIEARKLVEIKIINVSSRYILKILPDEAKETKYTPKRLTSDVEQVQALEDDLQSKIPPEKINIQTAYDLKEAETIPENEIEQTEDVEDLRGNKEEIADNVPPYIQLQLQERETLKQHNKELLERIEQLETKLQDKAFDEIRDSSKDSVKVGTFDLEVKDRIIPLKWNYAPTINRMIIEIDVNRARRMGI